MRTLPARARHMTVDRLLARHGIKLQSTAPGRHYTICSQCSRNRSKAHQENKVLGVTIEDGGDVRWGCNHCNWTGPKKDSAQGNGRAGGFVTTYDYCDVNGALLFQKVRNPPGHEQRFWCRRPDGKGGWISNTKNIKAKPLYRWPEVVE